MKSLQFRSIAPKAPAAATPAPSPALPEATATSCTKSILVPGQNYALMQIAGQDGTFSLVALPPPVSSTQKLPIPRYQSARSRGAPEKSRPPPGVSVQTQTKAGMNLKAKPANEGVVPKEEPADQVILIDSAPSDVSQMKPIPERSERPGLLHYAGPEESKPQNNIAVVAPSLFGKAVRLFPSPPKGKLPILPYARMKNALIPAAKLADPEKKTPPPVKPTEAPNRVQQPPTRTAFVTVGAQNAPAKKRGRKRKSVEDILAFEARKKRSLCFFRRRLPEKAPAVVPGFKQKEVDISKKYRSIQPKPLLVMETVPHLVGQRDLVLGPQIPPPPGPVTAPRPPHRCSQFKHQLQNHASSHSAGRPYICPLCRKAYAHRGSLSTHMKLHHAEVRPRRALGCEFCHKAFGYVGVYFRHLREVHKVVLTVEPSVSHHEVDAPAQGTAEASDEPDHEDPVELQIKCGRCQAVTPTFADMKMHLLYVHGEEPRPEQPPPGPPAGRQAENELVKHAAHYWRQLGKKRGAIKCGSCDEEFLSFAKLKRHVLSKHRRRRRAASPGLLAAGAAFNCVLCSELLDSKEQVTEHWRSRHHCEQPGLLWDALSSYSL